MDPVLSNICSNICGICSVFAFTGPGFKPRVAHNSGAFFWPSVLLSNCWQNCRSVTRVNRNRNRHSGGGGGHPPMKVAKVATRRNMRREERVTVQGPVKEQQPDGMSHRGTTPPPPPLYPPLPPTLSSISVCHPRCCLWLRPVRLLPLLRPPPSPCPFPSPCHVPRQPNGHGDVRVRHCPTTSGTGARRPAPACARRAHGAGPGALRPHAGGLRDGAWDLWRGTEAHRHRRGADPGAARPAAR